MADDADWAADMALLDRHRRRLPPPAPARAPATLDRVMDDAAEASRR
jgi:hypothetical protein